MELREQIALALINEIFAGTNDDVWPSWLPEADAVLEVMRPIIEERDALRAEIESMKKQEPAYYGPRGAIENAATTFIAGRFKVNPTDTALYLAPGAQGEQK